MRAIPSVAPNVDVILNLLIQSFQTPYPYSQAISTWFSSTVFLVSFRRFFTPCRVATYKATNDQFSSLFPHWVRRFFIDRAPRFSLFDMSSSLGDFLINSIDTVSSYVSHWVYEVFSTKPWPQTPTRLSELASKRESNCNVIKSYDQSHDRSNLFGIISYHNLSRGLLVICHLTFPIKSTFQFNLLNQPFESTYTINPLIKLAVPLAYGTLLFQQMYVRRRVYSNLLRYVWLRWLTFLWITHLLRREVYHPLIPLVGNVDESFAERSSDFSLVQTFFSSFMYIGVLTKMTMVSWWVDQ